MERTDKVKGSGFHFQRDHHHEVENDHDKTLDQYYPNRTLQGGTPGLPRSRGSTSEDTHTNPKTNNKANLKLHQVERALCNKVTHSNFTNSGSLTDTRYAGSSTNGREIKERKDSVDTDEENNGEASTSKICSKASNQLYTRPP